MLSAWAAAPGPRESLSQRKGDTAEEDFSLLSEVEAGELYKSFSTKRLAPMVVICWRSVDATSEPDTFGSHGNKLWVMSALPIHNLTQHKCRR